MAFNSKTKTLAIQLINGKISKFQNDILSDWTVEDEGLVRFPQPCTYFSICSMPDNLNNVFLEIEGITEDGF